MADDETRRRYQKRDGRMFTPAPKGESGGPPRWLWAIVIVIGGIFAFGVLGALVVSDDASTTVSAPNSRPVRAVSPSETTFEIRITGDGFDLGDVVSRAQNRNPERQPEPILFRGSLLVIGTGGSQSRSIGGATPETIAVTGTTVSVSVQKQREMGHLKVEILKNGVVVKSAETIADYGVVSVASN